LADRHYKGYFDPSHVISVDEASKLVGRPDVVFVDTRNYWKYAKGHVPGAVDLELFAFHWVDTSKDGIEAFAKQMAGLFGSLGIDRKKRVIFYQNNSGYDAARGVWLLELLGNANGMLLDGGLNLWRRKGKAVSTEDAEYRRADFSPRLNDAASCPLAELERHVERKDATVLDARNTGEHSGKYRRALKSGHIPGSMNIEWSRALRRDGTLKSAAQLIQIYGEIPRNSKVVTYCQSGYRAAHTWLVLGLLGYGDVKNYLGSWYEWGNAERTSVVK
jgi:thiosulfate/3-mercaptopyruvate sulfurtransferase